MWSLGNDKTLEVNGYNSLFFKKSWSKVGQEVTKAVKEFFKAVRILKQFNITSLTIIPTMENPYGLLDHIPIACCTVFYKVITKILASRMVEVFGKIVSPAQSAFVPHRKIMDNVLLVHEIDMNYITGKVDC